MNDFSDNERGPSLGEPAPGFDIISRGSRIKTNRCKGNWILLFSHPDDLIPAFKIKTINYVLCKRRIRAVALGDRQTLDLLPGRNFLGKYMVRHNLTIINDNDGEIAASYGLNNSRENNTETVKGLFVIDPKGILRMKLFFSQSTNRNFSEIMKLVEAVQTADSLDTIEPKQGRWKRPLGIVIKPRAIPDQG